MNFIFKAIGVSVVAILSLGSCTGSNTKAAGTDSQAVTDSIKEISSFDVDTAYNYIRQQVAFGPRVPGTEGNKLCQAFIISKLREAGAKVTEQHTEVTAYDGTVLPVNNIMGQFNPDTDNRIMLLAHYDTRPWADNEAEPADMHKPIPGANDGGSGVAVLLEIARQLAKESPAVGVDMLFVDAEDYGRSEGFGNNDETWCLGTQYWINHMPYTSENLPRYCIVVDMVGGLGAKFNREYFSNQNASWLVDKVWAMGARSGYGDYFINRDGGAITDDHVFINKGGIPAIDIIESRNETTRTFPSTWHTLNDNMSNIDRKPLKAVGQTLLNLIHSEK